MGVAAGQLLVTAAGSAGVIASLIFVTRSNRRLAKTQNLTNLQQILGEMNKLRTYRADHPDLEKALFENRETWGDIKIQQNLMAVQLANIFEWAFFAKREGLLDDDVWRSFIETWKKVILASPPLKDSFVDTVWTFGRDPSVMTKLKDLLDL
jgi:hypothetical protein